MVFEMLHLEQHQPNVATNERRDRDNWRKSVNEEKNRRLFTSIREALPIFRSIAVLETRIGSRDRARFIGLFPFMQSKFE